MLAQVFLFLITNFEGNVNMMLGLGNCKYETNWELGNVSFSDIWITSHWNRVYRTNKSWTSFTQIEFHFISIEFNSECWKSKVIFGLNSKMAPLWVFCPKLGLNSSWDVSSWWVAIKIILKASLPTLSLYKVFHLRVLEWRPFQEEINWN